MVLSQCAPTRPFWGSERGFILCEYGGKKRRDNLRDVHALNEGPPALVMAPFRGAPHAHCSNQGGRAARPSRARVLKIRNLSG